MIVIKSKFYFRVHFFTATASLYDTQMRPDQLSRWHTPRWYWTLSLRKPRNIICSSHFLCGQWLFSQSGDCLLSGRPGLMYCQGQPFLVLPRPYRLLSPRSLTSFIWATFYRNKRAGRGAGLSPLSSALVKNLRKLTSTSPFISITWCLNARKVQHLRWLSFGLLRRAVELKLTHV